MGCVCCMYQQVEGFFDVFYADHRGWCAGVLARVWRALLHQPTAL